MTPTLIISTMAVCAVLLSVAMVFQGVLAALLVHQGRQLVKHQGAVDAIKSVAASVTVLRREVDALGHQLDNVQNRVAVRASRDKKKEAAPMSELVPDDVFFPSREGVGGGDN